jgi:hypothetical protein
VLDPVQLGVLIRVRGLLPGPGPLEGDTPLVQDLPQPLPPDRHDPGAIAGRAIAGTGVPDADAMMISARRTRIDPCLPRRTICCSRFPS